MNVLSPCTRCNRPQHPLRRHLCHACYEKDRRAGRIQSLAEAAPARDYINALVIGGWNYREIARAADIDRSLVTFIVGGRQHIQHKTRAAICAIHPGSRARYVQTTWDTRRHKKAVIDWLAAELAYENAVTDWLAAERRHAPRRRAKTAEPTPIYEPDWTRTQPAAAMPMADDFLAEILADWREDATCAQVDPDLFFPEKGGSSRAAKAICRRCPVREQCLDAALAAHERFGIWGGYSERELRRITRSVPA